MSNPPAPPSEPKLPPRQPWPVGYAYSVAAVALAVALRLGLSGILGGDKGHFIILVLPVLVASYRGGVGPGLLALVLGFGSSLALYPHTVRERFDEPSEIATAILFALTCLGVIALAHRERQEKEARLRSEAEVARVNAELANLVKNRTAELEAANMELSNFCYSMAHDLRTPTRAIAGNARILLEDHGDQLPRNLADHLVRIHKAAVKQGALVDALLRYARLGQAPVARETLDVSPIVRTMVDEISVRDGADVKLELDPQLKVEADPRQFPVATRAVLENAIRYRKPGQPACIHVGCDTQGNLVVRDEGVGFDMTYAPKVVAPFERLHRDEVYPGVGMGVATVARILQRHEGTLFLNSRPNEGTTVRLNFGTPVTGSAVIPGPDESTWTYAGSRDAPRLPAI